MAQPKLKIDFDGYWKEIITGLFDEFVGFFLPDLYDSIDWNHPVEFVRTGISRYYA